MVKYALHEISKGTFGNLHEISYPYIKEFEKIYMHPKSDL